MKIIKINEDLVSLAALRFTGYAEYFWLLKNNKQL